MQARWGKGQGAMSSLEQTSRGTCMGPEAALFEQLNCCILDIPLFNSLGGKKKKGLEAENKYAKRSFTATNHSQTTFRFRIPHAIQRCHKNLIEITSNVMLVVYFWFSSKKIFTFHDRTE